jgi:subtilisin family serine protease
MSVTFPPELKYGNVVLTLNPNEVYVRFQEKFFDQIESYVEDYALVPIQTGTIPVRSPSPSLYKTGSETRSYWYQISDKIVEVQAESMLSDERTQIVSPVYYRKDLLPKKTGITYSDVILIKVKTKTSPQLVKKLVKNFGDIRSHIKLVDGELYRLQITDPKRANIFEIANHVANLSTYVKEARPDFVVLNSIFHRTPTDRYYYDQWALQKIEAPYGWDKNIGSPNIVIAIVDSGCDLNHEDLSSKYVSPAKRYNAIDATHNTDDTWGHGTCLAGIAAAKSNNARGVAGVAWKCKIMPIKILEDESNGVQEGGLLMALEWAITHDARVINMSWDWPAPDDQISSMLTRAHRANIVLVASAGNYYAKETPNEPISSPITFPANHRYVIAVGASDKDDRRKRYASPDGQCWGSNFGNGLSVVAPGVLILTTDITGRSGFNDQNGPVILDYLCIPSPYGPNGNNPDYNYCSSMGGTSGAAAFVSGLAALLISYRPRISNIQVQRAIEKTAEKVGGYMYVQDQVHHNGMWNIDMGYGRINIYNALKFVRHHLRDRRIKKSVTIKV